MSEKLNSSEQKPEHSRSLESPTRSEPQLPAKIEIDPSVAVARVERIDQNRSMELARLNAAQAALNVPLTQKSAAISSYDEERQNILSELGSRPVGGERARGTIGGIYETEGQKAVKRASAEREQRLEELLQQVLGKNTSVDRERDRARLSNSAPSVSEPIRLADFSSAPRGQSGEEQPRMEGMKSIEKNSLPQEHIRTARDAAQELLVSFKKARDIVGDPPKDYAMWAIQRGLPFSDTMTRLENFLKSSIETNASSNISPTIRQYFLELGPEETIRRAKSASSKLLQRVAQNVRAGNFGEVVDDMESLDPMYKRAVEKSRAETTHELHAPDRLLTSRGSNTHEIVRRIEKMNGSVR